jgi:hypothetical protein
MSESFKAQAARAGIQVAKSIGIGECTERACGCGGLFVQLVDERDKVFAVGPLTPETALAFAEMLRAEALRKLGGVQ